MARMIMGAAPLLLLGGCVTNISARAAERCAPLLEHYPAGYYDCVSQETDRMEASNRRTARIIAAGLGGAARASAAPYPGASARLGVFRRTFVSGFNRVCVYDDLGSARYLTIRAAELCPLSQ